MLVIYMSGYIHVHVYDRNLIGIKSGLSAGVAASSGGVFDSLYEPYVLTQKRSHARGRVHTGSWT
jgi:hypothetical protein